MIPEASTFLHPQRLHANSCRKQSKGTCHAAKLCGFFMTLMYATRQSNWIRSLIPRAMAGEHARSSAGLPKMLRSAQSTVFATCSSGSPGDQRETERIASLEAEIAELQAQLKQSRVILDSATDYAIITLDMHGFVTGWNIGAQRIMGYADDEILGRSGEIVFTSEDRASSRFAIELRRAVESGRADNERWHLRKDGTRFWASGMMMPLLDAEGRPTGFLNILRDCTDARAEFERQELMMAEMNHRIKNTFSTVQAVARQTRRHATTVTEFQTALDNRLMVLSRSHDVLISSDWEDAPLQDVISSALEAYGDEPGRLTIAGPPVLLRASLTVTICLAFHELATNAVKYGALSVPGGQVNVTWTTTPVRNDASWISIIWRERGGPVVEPPTRRGFGTTLLEKGMPLGGKVQLVFQPEGVECHICLPPGSEG